MPSAKARNSGASCNPQFAKRIPLIKLPTQHIEEKYIQQVVVRALRDWGK
jgi:hypothetical protein